MLDNTFWENKVSAITPLSSFMVSYSCGYFVYDVIQHFTEESLYQKFEFYIHAISACSTFLYYYIYNTYHFYAAALLTWETSSPFLYTAFYLSKHKKTHTLLFKINSWFLVMTFFIFRICFGSYIIFYESWYLLNIPLKIIGLTMTTLNCLWFRKLMLKFMEYHNLSFSLQLSS